MEGLTLGYGQGDVEQTTNTKSDESTMFAKYATGQVTVGIQMSEKDNESGNDYETTGVGISYQVNDDLAVSYGSHITEVDEVAIQIKKHLQFRDLAMGSLSMSLSMHQVDNINNVATNDREAYNVSLGFAF